MKRQRGQSVVEFAFVLPMFTLFLFGVIYGGIMFLDYLNLCNDARAEARRVAVMSNSQRETYFKNSDIKTDEFTRFYNVTRKIWIAKDDETELEDVIVRVEFERDNEDVPNVLKLFNWPPKEFAIQYRMQVEQDNE